MLSVVDSGPLIAVLDPGDRNHARCLEVLTRPDLDLVIPAMVVAEVAYFAQRNLGPRVEAGFLRGLTDFDVQAPHPQDWPRIAELVERYANFPLGGTDASVVALAERLGTDVIVTLDHRHFPSIRPRHTTAFRLLPD